jgi:hypothetical protein
VRDGCAAATAVLPELDGIQLTILGLHNCQDSSVLHMHASGPACSTSGPPAVPQPACTRWRWPSSLSPVGRGPANGVDAYLSWKYQHTSNDRFPHGESVRDASRARSIVCCVRSRRVPTARSMGRLASCAPRARACARPPAVSATGRDGSLLSTCAAFARDQRFRRVQDFLNPNGHG